MAIESFWQFTQADGDPDWPVGGDTYQHAWQRAFELLKFDKPGGFTIENRGNGHISGKLSLKEVEEKLEARLRDNGDVVFVVRSLRTHHALAFRRRTVKVDDRHGAAFLDRGRELLGAPYRLGAVGPGAADCSGLVMWESSPFGVSWGPFYTNRAQVMWDEAKKGNEGKVIIPRAKILKGDLLIIHDGDHIATYIDDEGGGRVLDAEPSSVQSPWGWTPGGVQVRSMSGNYYCAWGNVNAVVRVIKVNGAP